MNQLDEARRNSCFGYCNKTKKFTFSQEIPLRFYNVQVAIGGQKRNNHVRQREITITIIMSRYLSLI